MVRHSRFVLKMQDFFFFGGGGGLGDLGYKGYRVERGVFGSPNPQLS